MESELLNAANEGSVELLRQDKLALQRYMAERLKQTPLHIAAMKGHLEFTKEVLENMPEMSFAKDGERRNPLHMAVIKGHIDIVKVILRELLKFKPQAAAQALLGAPTILHLCVKHHELEALKCILEVFPDDAEFVNSKDEEGSSILHLAVAEKQTEVVKFLLQKHRKIDVNARNAHGFTAWDISLAQDRRDSKTREVAACLQQARGCFGTGLVTKFKSLCFSTAKEDPLENKKQLEESCNAFMIVASIITTVTFQALIQPPEKYGDGTSGEYAQYMLFNTLSFSATVGVLLLLISGFHLKHRALIWILRITMWIAVLSAAFVVCNVADVVFWESENTRIDAADIMAWVMVISTIILTVGHAIRVIIKTVIYLQNLRKDRKRRAKLNAQGQSRV